MTWWLAMCLAQAAAVAPAADEQDPDRPAISLSDLKSLRDNNIFAPHKPKRFEPRRERKEERTERAPEPPARPKPPVVTGIVFDEGSKAFQAIVEDRNSDAKLKYFAEPKFLKVGDEVVTYTLETITAEHASFRQGETLKELRVGQELVPPASLAPVAPAPETTTTAPSTPTEKAESAPIEDAAKAEVFKRLKEKNKKKRSSEDFDEPK